MKIKKTITDNVIEASRKNGSKGSGPKTERGKNAVSQNANKIGVYARKLRFRNEEEQTAFNVQLAKFKGSVDPDDPIKQMAAEHLVVEEFRMGRGLEIEQSAWKRHNAATDIAVRTLENSELIGGDSLGVLDSKSGWECTELTLGARKEGENLVRNGPVAQNTGNGQHLELHAKFQDPMEKALRYRKETSRDFYRAFDKFLKLR